MLRSFHIRLAILIVTIGLMTNFASTWAYAKNLPSGDYALVGDIFPGIRQGKITWTYAHIKTKDDLIEWTFSKPYGSGAVDCDQRGKCHQHVQNLRHRISWSGSGIVTVLETVRDQSDGLTIENPEVDGPFILDEANRIIDNAYMELEPSGGGIIPTGQDRLIFAIPVTKRDFEDALALVQSFDMNLYQTGQCGLIQALTLMSNQEQTELGSEMVQAARFHGEFQRLRDVANYFKGSTVPEDKREFITERSLEFLVWELAYSNGISFVHPDVTRQGSASDDEILNHLKKVIAERVSGINDKLLLLLDELIFERGRELLSAIRLGRRFSFAKHMSDNNLLEAYCTDFTFGNVRFQ